MSRRAVRRYEAALAEQVARASQGVTHEGGTPENVASTADLPEGRCDEVASVESDSAEDGRTSSAQGQALNMFDMLAVGLEEDDDAQEDDGAEADDSCGLEPVSEELKVTSGDAEVIRESLDREDLLEVSKSTPAYMTDGRNAFGNESASGKQRRKRKKRKGKEKVDDDDWFTPQKDVDVDVASNTVDTGPCFQSSTKSQAVDSQSSRVTGSGSGANNESGSPRNSGSDTTSIDLIPMQLLGVRSHLLNTDSEIKQLFGARVVEAGRMSEESDAMQQRRHSRQRRQPNQRPGSYFVRPRETWWREAPGLVVVIDNSANEAIALHSNSTDLRRDDDVSFFRYSYERRYQRIQHEFEVIRLSHNPNDLVAFCSRFPFHVDSLLALSEIYRQTGEVERAGEMIERALYVLESSWPRSFKPFSGKCRMSYNVRANQSLFHALFRHVQILARRGLHRTALECAKLLYSLDPPLDPTGILLVMDSLALMCGEYAWVRAMHAVSTPGALKLFPNFAVSAAVALQLMHSAPPRGGRSRKRRTSADRSEQLPAAHDASEPPMSSGALQQMTDALLAYPMVLRPIMSISEDTDGLAICDMYDLFNEQSYSSEDPAGALGRVSRIYSRCSKGLWTGIAMQLLRDAAICAGSAAAGGRGSDGQALAEAGRGLRIEAASFVGMFGDSALVPNDFGDAETSIPGELLAALNAEEEAIDAELGGGSEESESLPSDAEPGDAEPSVAAPREDVPAGSADDFAHAAETSGPIAQAGREAGLSSWGEAIWSFVQSLTSSRAGSANPAEQDAGPEHDSATDEA